MARNDGIDMSELGAFANRMSRTAGQSPQKQRAFLRQEGAKLSRKTKSEARVVQEVAINRQKYQRTPGQYHKSIKRGKVYVKDDALQVRVYSSDPVAHLLEDGHEVVTAGGIRTGEHTRAFEVFNNAQEAFAPEFEADCEDMIDRVINSI